MAHENYDRQDTSCRLCDRLRNRKWGGDDGDGSDEVFKRCVLERADGKRGSFRSWHALSTSFRRMHGCARPVMSPLTQPAHSPLGPSQAHNTPSPSCQCRRRRRCIADRRQKNPTRRSRSTQCSSFAVILLHSDRLFVLLRAPPHPACPLSPKTA